MKWVYGILIIICLGTTVYHVNISSPYSILWAINTIMYTIFFVGELICNKIDNLYEKISINSK